MVFLKIGFILMIGIILNGCQQQTVENLINNRYLESKKNIKNLDRYSYILDVNKSRIFKEKMLGKKRSTFSILLKNHILYIKIRFFDTHVKDKILDAIASTKDIQGIILDIRDNTGGLVEEALVVTDIFLSKGLIVQVKGKSYKQDYFAKTSKTDITLPLVVVVNHKSASASEILAGALQAHHRAVILGDRTFGKGRIQEVIALPNQRLLKLTVEEYTLLHETQVEHKGITPDFTFHENTLVLQSQDIEYKKIYNHLLREKKDKYFHGDRYLLLSVAILSSMIR